MVLTVYSTCTVRVGGDFRGNVVLKCHLGRFWKTFENDPVWKVFGDKSAKKFFFRVAEVTAPLVTTFHGGVRKIGIFGTWVEIGRNGVWAASEVGLCGKRGGKLCLGRFRRFRGNVVLKCHLGRFWKTFENDPFYAYSDTSGEKYFFSTKSFDPSARWWSFRWLVEISNFGGRGEGARKKCGFKISFGAILENL